MTAFSWFVFCVDGFAVSPHEFVTTTSRSKSTKRTYTSAEIRGSLVMNENDTFRLDNKNEDTVSKVLGIIESQRKNCTPGTDLSLDGVVDQYGQKKFNTEAQIALNRANLLTRLWKYSPAIFYSTDSMIQNQTEYLLYAAVRTMVELNANIHSAGNCYDWFRFPHYDLFCPFAHRMPSGLEITAKDLASAYKYGIEGNDTENEWFSQPKKNAEKAILRHRINSVTGQDHTRKGQ